MPSKEQGIDKTVPNKIFLQWHGEGDPQDPRSPSQGDVTWSKDKVFEHDIEYVKAPEIQRLEARVGELEAAINNMMGSAINETAFVIGMQALHNQQPSQEGV